MRRSALLPTCLLALAPLLAGCPMPTSGLAQAQQTAQEFNMDARFGRNELLATQIAPTARDQFMAHHRLWGGPIRVADVEIAGMKTRGDKDVEFTVHVAWYRPEQQELRSTTLQQSWHAKTDGWELVGEQRVDGDIGLLGEPVVFEQPAEPRPPTQFPTIRIGGGEPAAAD